jgi:hypothetical protein
MQLPILKRIVALLKEQGYKAGYSLGKKGWGILKDLFNEQRKYFPWITSDTVNNYSVAHMEENLVPGVIETKNITGISGLTDASHYKHLPGELLQKIHYGT